MSLFKLVSNYQPAGDQPQAIKKLLAGLAQGAAMETLLGITGSGKTFTMANVIQAWDKPVLVIAPNKTLAAQLYREYQNYFPENSVNYFVSYYDYYQPEAYLPITDTYIEKEAMINQEIDRLRHKATTALLTRRDVIIVASVSCIYNLGVPENYFSSALLLELGMPITRQELIQRLVKIQFTRTPGELARGKFRVRGDNFDLQVAAEKLIYRLEIKDNKVARLEIYDALTHKIIETPKDVLIFPPKHFVTGNAELNKALTNIRAELKERLAYFKKKNLLLEAQRLERRTRYDLEMMKSLGYCSGIENYSRQLMFKSVGDPPDTLLSYFPKIKGKPDFLTVIDESHISIPQIGGMYAGDRSRKTTLVEHGWRLPSALDNRPLKFPEFLARVGQIVCTSATPGKYELENSKVFAEQIIRPTGLVDPAVEIRPVYDQLKKKSQVDDLLLELAKIVKQGERAIINTLTKKMAEDFVEYLTGQGIKSRYMHSDTKTLERGKILKEFRQGKFSALVGVNLLREGLDLPEVTLVAILDADREGFLRSETSLMQTMGRASRNVSGKVILYADTMTRSLTAAVKEVKRRRSIQLAYNKKHRITPKTTMKKIEDLIVIK